MCQDVYNHAATIGPYAITIYVILRCHADGKTSEPVWPGLTRLQKLSGFSRSIVVKALRALLKVGLIEVTLRGAQQHQYRFPKLVHAVNQSTVRTGSPDEPNRFTARTSTGSRDEPELVHAVNPNKTQLPRLKSAHRDERNRALWSLRNLPGSTQRTRERWGVRKPGSHTTRRR